MLTPFPYQVEAIKALRDGFRKGVRRGLMTMLMGGGKSIAALELMRLSQDRGNFSLFLSDRRLLSQQIVGVAQDQGLDAGLLLAGHGHDLGAKCQFASKQTLMSWTKRGLIDLPDFKLVIVDECHRAVSKTWIKLYTRWPGAYYVGLTATPCLGNGNGMGHYYDFIVQPIQPSGLKAMGRIVTVRAFAPHNPKLDGVKKDKDGDYSARSLSALMTRENLIGDIPGWWKKLGENRPSIYFACDVAHALQIREDFRASGVSAELICDETPDDERDEIRRRSENGDLKIVVNCDVLAEGIDWPWISCIGLVRPTKRLRRYLQNAGRGMRACEGKVDCILIDHAGCVLYHGFPDIDRDWPLSPADNVDKAAQEKKKNEPASMRCSQCSAIFSGTNKCPECGHVHAIVKTPKEYANKNGTLIEVARGDLPPEVAKTLMQRFWGTCIGVAIKRNKHAGMAAGMFSGKFGKPPWTAGVRPMPDSPGDWQRPARDVFPGFTRSRA